MNAFTSLVKLFFYQLMRSKALWLVSGVMLLMVLLNVYYLSQISEWLEGGMTYDMATRKASSKLKDLSAQIKTYGVLFVVMVSALIAPASRKNGTTQFALSMQVSRWRLASAQYAALSLFIGAALLIIHVGFGIAALRVGYIGVPELVLAWIPLLLPLLMASAASFSLSLVFSSMGVYLILLGIPQILLPLIDSLMKWKGQWAPVALARLADNIGMLFPSPESLMFWPFLSIRATIADPPYPVWTWTVSHYCFATLFWIVAGYYLYRCSNIGSRQMLK